MHLSQQQGCMNWVWRSLLKEKGQSPHPPPRTRDSSPQPSRVRLNFLQSGEQAWFWEQLLELHRAMQFLALPQGGAGEQRGRNSTQNPSFLCPAWESSAGPQAWTRRPPHGPGASDSLGGQASHRLAGGPALLQLGETLMDAGFCDHLIHLQFLLLLIIILGQL